MIFEGGGGEGSQKKRKWKKTLLHDDEGEEVHFMFTGNVCCLKICAMHGLTA